MKTKLLGTIGAIVLCGLGTQAYATTVNSDLGVIAPGTSSGGFLFIGSTGTSIDDNWSFELTETLLTAIVVDSADLLPFFSIDDFLTTATDALISFTYDAADNRYEFSGVLPAGVYEFNVSGVTSGSLGGEFEVIVGAVTVPVPAALWLFSGALLLVVRRSTNNASVRT